MSAKSPDQARLHGGNLGAVLAHALVAAQARAGHLLTCCTQHRVYINGLITLPTCSEPAAQRFLHVLRPSQLARASCQEIATQQKQAVLTAGCRDTSVLASYRWHSSGYYNPWYVQQGSMHLIMSRTCKEPEIKRCGGMGGRCSAQRSPKFHCCRGRWCTQRLPMHACRQAPAGRAGRAPGGRERCCRMEELESLRTLSERLGASGGVALPLPGPRAASGSAYITCRA